VDTAWAQLEPDFTELCRDYPKLKKTNNRKHLGTLGTGNHFIEVCLDEAGFVWFMLHSGSRGVGNASARCSSSWRSRTRCATTQPAGP
jgi:tRNA-splicing ligase RtcB